MGQVCQASLLERWLGNKIWPCTESSTSWYAHHPSLYHQNISETKICIPPKKHLLSFSHLQGKCVRPIWTIFPVNIHGLMVSGLNLHGKHYKAPAEIWEELNNKRACFAHTGNFTTKFFPRKEALVITHSRCVACPVQVGVSRKITLFMLEEKRVDLKALLLPCQSRQFHPCCRNTILQTPYNLTPSCVIAVQQKLLVQPVSNNWRQYFLPVDYWIYIRT